jgi:hypothetical protein
MPEGGEPAAPSAPGLLLLSYTTPRDAARIAGRLQASNLLAGVFQEARLTAIDRIHGYYGLELEDYGLGACSWVGANLRGCSR